MNGQESAISWFEIPTIDIDRARKFYESIFAMEMIPMPVGEEMLYMFPSGEGKTGGALSADANAVASMDGVLVYLNANPSMENILDRVEAAGGKVLLPKTEIGENFGYFSFINDSEGNRIGLHSNA